MEKVLGREAVLGVLGIKPQTLYAYVSRGLLNASPDPDDPRRSLYSAEDVAMLANRRKRGRSRTAVATGSIAWGDPVLETAISTVAHGRLIYRGEDAAELANAATFEQVASLLIGQPVHDGAEAVVLLTGCGGDEGEEGGDGEGEELHFDGLCWGFDLKS